MFEMRHAINVAVTISLDPSQFAKLVAAITGISPQTQAALDAADQSVKAADATVTQFDQTKGA